MTHAKTSQATTWGHEEDAAISALRMLLGDAAMNLAHAKYTYTITNDEWQQSKVSDQHVWSSLVDAYNEWCTRPF